MNHQIIIKDESGDIRLQQKVEDGETFLVEAGDEILLIDENGNAAEVALTPDGSNLIVEFLSGEQLILEEYFSSGGIAPPINLNVSPDSNVELYNAHFANEDSMPAGRPDSTTGTSDSSQEGPPSQLLPTAGEPVGSADVSFEGGVGNLPQGQDFTLMRLSNLGFTEFEETFSSFTEDVSAFVGADETPAPRGFGGGSSTPPEIQPEPQAAPAPLPETDPPVIPTPAPTPTPPVVIPPVIPDLPPVAIDDTITTDEDLPIDIAVIANDFDLDGGTISVSAVGTPSSGTTSINLDGSIRYTPDPNFFGTDTFTYEVKDNDGLTDTATVTVTVNSVDDLPVAADDAISVDEDNSVSGTLAGNDTPSGDGGNVWALASGPSNGTATVNNDGTYTYTPNANYNGADSFTYTITDADGDVSTATASITVNSVDDLPVAADDAISVDEDDSVSGTLAGNDTPSGDGGNVWALASGPGNGIVTINNDGTYTYTPSANYNGSDSFTYTITDADGDVSTATASITVNSVDDLPVAADDAISVDEDDSVSGTLAGNDTPSGDGGNIWAIASGPSNGSVTVNNDGTYTYTPSANYNGADSFTYTITDADGDVSTATASITVNSVDDLPVAADDAISVDEDDSVSGTLAGNDTPSGDGGNVW
ncbi:MAG: Ig-like domain-containing protein, partial [Verrucomicrobiota bacterium]